MSTVLPTAMNTVEYNDGLPTEFEFVREPSYTYKLNETTVVGKIDELEAYKQAVYKLLNTERYKYIIYSWDYGVELNDLIGKPISYAIPELERRLTEAIMQDDRTISVDGFQCEVSAHGVVYVTLTCHSIYGDFKLNMTAEI